MILFQPREFRKTVQDIDFQALKAKGISHLILDLDETLRKRNDDHIPDSSIEWIKKAEAAGFNVCVSSNSLFPWKFGNVRKKLHVPSFAFTLKPFPFAFWKAFRILGSNPKNTAMVGDQLFTDILGANILGIYSVMVSPVTKDEKGFHRRIMRWLESLFYRPAQ